MEPKRDSDVPPGPLLYHFENMANELSVELSYEEIRTAVSTIGFHIEVRQMWTGLGLQPLTRLLMRKLSF